MGYGQARPYLPGIVRSLFGGEREFEARDYLDRVDGAFGRFLEESDECRARQDQRCLTEANARLYEGLGDAVPATAGWMSEAHQDLRRAVYDSLTLNERSEAGERTPALIRDVLSAQTRLGVALERWSEAASR